MGKEINVQDHIFVPKHEKLSENEKKEILTKYNVSVKQFPKIGLKDAAIKHLEVKIGDIVKITRKSPTAGDSVYYRVVME